MNNNILEIKNLNTTIGDFSLKNINFSIEKGTITGFIGKNGSGKTTLIKTMLDLFPRESGKVLFWGKDMYENEIEVKSNIGVVFDDFSYSQNQKAINLVKMICPFYSNFDIKKFESLANTFNLNLNKKLYEYSKGMQMKFSIAMALCHEAKLLILDEPTSGLDPVSRSELLNIFYDIIQDEEKSIFFSTHITSDLDKIADYIVMIDNGEIVFSKAKDELLENYALVHMDKQFLTPEIKNYFVGLKETSFSYEGIIYDRSKIKLIPNAKVTRPTLEDIMIYRGDL